MDKRDLANVDRSAQRLNRAATSNLSLTEIISVESRLVYKHQVLELSIALATSSEMGANISTNRCFVHS